MAADTARAKEYMEAFGTVLEQELPDCQVNTGNWILPLLLLSISVFFVYIIKVWGFPIVAVAIFVAGYTVVTSAAWYFQWTDHHYLTTAIGTVEDGVRNYKGGVAAARNALIIDSSGLLGQFLGITVNVVFPYVVLGSLFGGHKNKIPSVCDLVEDVLINEMINKKNVNNEQIALGYIIKKYSDEFSLYERTTGKHMALFTELA